MWAKKTIKTLGFQLVCPMLVPCTRSRFSGSHHPSVEPGNLLHRQDVDGPCGWRQCCDLVSKTLIFYGVNLSFYVKNFWIKPLVGGLEHFLCSPILGMMIQSDSYFLDKKTIGLSVLRFIILYSGYNDQVSTDIFGRSCWKIILISRKINQHLKFGHVGKTMP